MKMGLVLESLALQLGNAQEAEVILSTAVGLRRSELYLKRDLELSSELLEKAKIWAKLRKSGVPLQYVLGEAGFFNHLYRVTPDVLIPRPETEVLVQTAIEFLRKRDIAHGFEWGLGSGVISIELCSEFKNLKMIATDCSEAALQIATENELRILGPSSSRIEKILVDQRDSLAEIETKLPRWSEWESHFDFIISNPPYLDPAQVENETLPDVIRFEPREALFPASEDPLSFYKSMAVRGQNWLKPDGLILVEIPHERSDVIHEIFESQGWKAKVIEDLNSRPRVIVAEQEREHG